MQNMPDFTEIMRLANTPEGRQLIAMLQNADSRTLSNALHSAQSGDYDAAKTVLSSLMNTPEARELLSRFGR